MGAGATDGVRDGSSGAAVTAAIEILTAARHLDARDVYRVIQHRLAHVDEANIVFALTQLALVDVARRSDERPLELGEFLAASGLCRAVNEAMSPPSGPEP